MAESEVFIIKKEPHILIKLLFALIGVTILLIGCQLLYQTYFEEPKLMFIRALLTLIALFFWYVVYRATVGGLTLQFSDDGIHIGKKVSGWGWFGSFDAVYPMLFIHTKEGTRYQYSLKYVIKDKETFNKAVASIGGYIPRRNKHMEENMNILDRVSEYVGYWTQRTDFIVLVLTIILLFIALWSWSNKDIIVSIINVLPFIAIIVAIWAIYDYFRNKKR